MVKDDYQMIKYRPEYRNAVLEIQRHLWSPDTSTNAAYMDWKYGQNPYEDEVNIFLAVCNQQVVGMVGAYGSRWQFGATQKTLPIPCFADLVIRPDHRSQGLFAGLMSFALDELAKTGHRYLLDLSATPETTLIQLMSGWRNVEFLQTAHRQPDQTGDAIQINGVSPERRWLAATSRKMYGVAQRVPAVYSTARRLKRVAKKILVRDSNDDLKGSPFADIDKRLMGNQHRTSMGVRMTQSPDPRRMAQLIKRIDVSDRLRHVRDETYFSWRFQNPLSDYRFLYWENNENGLDGYLVLQTKRTSTRFDRVNIADWEAAVPVVKACLLDTAVRNGSFGEMFVWSSTLSEMEKRVLNGFGFVFSEKTGSIRRDVLLPAVLIRSLLREESEQTWSWQDCRLLDIKNWDIRMVYSDMC